LVIGELMAETTQILAKPADREVQPTVPVSVLIPVMNEEQNIGPCIDSVAWADEVVVIDSHSTDRTGEIARARGARVHQFNYRGGWPKKKNWALAELPLAHQWILLIDADERVTPELAEEIARRMKDPEGCDGFYVNRRLMFLGRWIRHAGWYPSWNMRLFRRNSGRFERPRVEDIPNTGDVEVHEHVVLQGKAAYLEHDLVHHDLKNISHFVDRHNRYSTWEAVVYDSLRQGGGTDGIGASLFGTPVQRKRWIKRFWVKLPGRPLLRFLWMYILKRGFLDGRPGLIFCLLMSFHEAVIGAKLYERRLEEKAS
jgi:glycosyltransferase involved in cell wall biosynthesis